MRRYLKPRYTDRTQPRCRSAVSGDTFNKGEIAIPNIVYALTNPAMPGIVKIGMTDRDDVQRRMADLYTTGVPLPFECAVAREIDGREALEIENALHTAFGPNRVNSSREFFQIDPEQVQALLKVMPGRDVTPKTPERDAGAQDDDEAASNEYKKRQARTNELEFIDSLNEHGVVIYQRVLALGDQEGMRVKWGIKGFSLNVVSNGTLIPMLYGYPPAANNQRIYTEFGLIAQKANVPQDVMDSLRKEALDTGLFNPAGRGNNLSCRTDLPLEESQLEALTGWLNTVIVRIREYEGSSEEAQTPS